MIKMVNGNKNKRNCKRHNRFKPIQAFHVIESEDGTKQWWVIDHTFMELLAQFERVDREKATPKKKPRGKGKIQRYKTRERLKNGFGKSVVGFKEGNFKVGLMDVTKGMK